MHKLQLVIAQSQGAAGVVALTAGAYLAIGLGPALVVLGLVLLAAEAWRSR